MNGFILRGGALHVRGLVSSPSWHSLRAAWQGEGAISRLYPSVLPTDVPFGQDCVGDQFLLREGSVLRLEAETGEVEEIADSLVEFLSAASQDPTEVLQAQPLLSFMEDGRTLAPGKCLLASPPFCTKEAAQGVSLADVPADELLQFHAQFARAIQDVADGGKIRLEVTD